MGNEKLDLSKIDASDLFDAVTRSKTVRECKLCSAEFESMREDQIYCSARCRTVYHSAARDIGAALARKYPTWAALLLNVARAKLEKIKESEATAALEESIEEIVGDEAEDEAEVEDEAEEENEEEEEEAGKIDRAKLEKINLHDKTWYEALKDYHIAAKTLGGDLQKIEAQLAREAANMEAEGKVINFHKQIVGETNEEFVMRMERKEKRKHGKKSK